MAHIFASDRKPKDLLVPQPLRLVLLYSCLLIVGVMGWRGLTVHFVRRLRDFNSLGSVDSRSDRFKFGLDTAFCKGLRVRRSQLTATISSGSVIKSSTVEICQRYNWNGQCLLEFTSKLSVHTRLITELNRPNWEQKSLNLVKIITETHYGITVCDESSGQWKFKVILKQQNWTMHPTFPLIECPYDGLLWPTESSHLSTELYTELRQQGKWYPVKPIRVHQRTN